MMIHFHCISDRRNLFDKIKYFCYLWQTKSSCQFWRNNNFILIWFLPPFFLVKFSSLMWRYRKSSLEWHFIAAIFILDSPTDNAVVGNFWLNVIPFIENLTLFNINSSLPAFSRAFLTFRSTETQLSTYIFSWTKSSALNAY